MEVDGPFGGAELPDGFLLLARGGTEINGFPLGGLT